MQTDYQVHRQASLHLMYAACTQVAPASVPGGTHHVDMPTLGPPSGAAACALHHRHDSTSFACMLGAHHPLCAYVLHGLPLQSTRRGVLQYAGLLGAAGVGLLAGSFFRPFDSAAPGVSAADKRDIGEGAVLESWQIVHSGWLRCIMSHMHRCILHAANACLHCAWLFCSNRRVSSRKQVCQDQHTALLVASYKGSVSS